MHGLKRILILIFFNFIIIVAGAQDLHFSQFYNAPLLTNPANTGFLPDADYRIGAHYRNQWSSILADPYKTTSVFGDAQVLRNKFDNGWVGIGGAILSDVAGAGSLRSTKVYVSAAYHQMLEESSLLSAGVNMGWVNKRIDASKLKFPDQYDGQFFDNSLPTSVDLFTSSVHYFDMQVGLNYAYFPDDNTYLNVGYSIQHVNRPVETFFSQSPDSARIALRHIGFINALLKVNYRVIINPGMYYSVQAIASEFVVGMNANYNLTDGGGIQLIAGAYYRAGDAVIPSLGFQLAHVRFTFSYDATVSTLKTYNNMMGASEFNVIKNGYYSVNDNDSRKVLCPKF